MCTALDGPGYTAIATHDPRIIDAVERFVAEREYPQVADASSSKCSTASRHRSRKRCSNAGIACASPCRSATIGFPYLMRRLAERPANLAFFLKGALTRG